MSKVKDCKLTSVGTLSFDYYYGGCNTFSFGIMLCFFRNRRTISLVMSFVSSNTKLIDPTYFSVLMELPSKQNHHRSSLIIESWRLDLTAIHHLLPVVTVIGDGRLKFLIMIHKNGKNWLITHSRMEMGMYTKWSNGTSTFFKLNPFQYRILFYRFNRWECFHHRRGVVWGSTLLLINNRWIQKWKLEKCWKRGSSSIWPWCNHLRICHNGHWWSRIVSAYPMRSCFYCHILSTNTELWEFDSLETQIIDPTLSSRYGLFGVFLVDVGYCSKN